jgi:hypothetical protein
LKPDISIRRHLSFIWFLLWNPVEALNCKISPQIEYESNDWIIKFIYSDKASKETLFTECCVRQTDIKKAFPKLVKKYWKEENIKNYPCTPIKPTKC